MKFVDKKLKRIKSKTATLTVNDEYYIIDPLEYTLVGDDFIYFNQARILDENRRTIGVHEALLNFDDINEIQNGGVLYE